MKIVKQLVQLGITFVQITLDGPKDIHDQRRILHNGQLTFDVIMNNLKNLGHLKNKIRIGVHINIDSQNKDSALEVLDLITNEGLRDSVDVGYGLIQKIYSCAIGESDCLASQEFLEFDKRGMRILTEKGFLRKVPNPFPKSNYCTADSITGMIIGPNGDLYKCWNDVGRISESVGFLKSGDLSMNNNLIKWLAWDPLEDTICLECEMLPVCMGGCPWIRRYLKGLCDDKWKALLIERLKMIYAINKKAPLDRKKSNKNLERTLSENA